MARPV